jgi:hypothetical protein
MPLISDISKKTKTRFQKKSYRPWDDELSEVENSKIDDNPNKLSNKTNIESDRTNEASYNKANQSSLLSKDNGNYFDTLDLKKELRNLFGAQKIIVQYLLNQIEENDNEYFFTKAISMDEFTTECKLPQNTIKGMLQKLKNKRLIEAYENKPGRGGYARYKFNKIVYSFFIKNLNNVPN